MLVKDEISGKQINVGEAVKIVKSFSGKCKKKFNYGYTKEIHKCPEALFVDDEGNVSQKYCTPQSVKNKFIYSNRRGLYMCKDNLSESTMVEEQFIYGKGLFPYHFMRRYEAIESFEIFRDKQEILKDKKFPLAKHMKYSFGLEFETSEGLIPEHICFRDGLIPLRDGSISGLEYSTIVLSGNEGLNLLAQQLETLKKYTNFNKECSLHIHFGGFPLESEAIYRLYWICQRLQSSSSFTRLLPPLCFKTSEYKASGKDYCKLLPTYRDFDSLYRSLVGQRFFGSFTQPHPNDVERNRKWQVSTRYYWVNLINLLCYNVNKTVEFRFLRPTYNLKKILVWMYVMNAILHCAETEDNIMYEFQNSSDVVNTLLELAYRDDPELVEKLKLEKSKLLLQVDSQLRNKDDRIGDDLVMEDKLFPCDEII